MSSIRINVSLPEDTFEELSKAVDSRKRSQFITKAVRLLLKKERAQRLAVEYQEAAAETRKINTEFEGAISDGLD
jgi:metal-responsive CopG/Arc/MetJ family transcriptional regulator